MLDCIFGDQAKLFDAEVFTHSLKIAILDYYSFQTLQNIPNEKFNFTGRLQNALTADFAEKEENFWDDRIRVIWKIVEDSETWV